MMTGTKEFIHKKTTPKLIPNPPLSAPYSPMNDALLLISEHLLSAPINPASLLAFVKLQATSRSVWLHYLNDTALWRRLNDSLPRWSLPEHMGLRRR